MFGSLDILTRRQREVYGFIACFEGKHGYPPTVREIASGLACSPATAHEHLQRLKDAGAIASGEGRNRALSLLHGNPERTLPLLGQIAAGAPLLADEHVEDHIEIPRSLRRGGTEFLLRARGDSMIEAGILDGDLLIVQQQPDARSGQIVAALVGEDEGAEEATVKLFYRESGRVRLQPANSSMSAWYPEWLQLLGIVTGQLRSY